MGPTCRIYANWQDLFDEQAVDGVIVATPPSAHATIAETAMRSQHPILIEKPIALTITDADRLMKTAASGRVIVHVDHTNLYNPALAALRRSVDSPSVIRGLRGAWNNDGPVRESIHGLWDYGAHAVAACLALMNDEPDEIAATFVRRTESAELVDLRLRWGEVTAALEIGNAGDRRTRWLEIETETHRLRYDDITDRKALVDDRPIDYPDELPLTIAVERFVAAIRQGVPDTADLELGSAVVRTLSKAQDSLEATT